MPKMTQYKHGTFCWVDLATSDPDAAKKFYGGLFGWQFVDMPAEGMTYTMCQLGGEQVCALYKMGAEMQGMPPHWLAYVSVENVDATTKQAAQNGAKVMKDAFDVMSVGRMAVLQDPTGAVLALWQAKQHIGATVVKDPGTMCWNELFTSNVDQAGKFYVQTLGWQTEAFDMGPMGVYTLFARKGEGKEGQVGGMMAMPQNMKGVPSHWLNYFAVTDVDASAKKVAELKGNVVMPPTDIPNIGRFAIVQDPQGATFAIYKNAH